MFGHAWMCCWNQKRRLAACLVSSCEMFDQLSQRLFLSFCFLRHGRQPSTFSPEGIYAVRLFDDLTQRWCWVVVDDYVPVSEHCTPVMAHSRNGREIWVAILEKAFAKVEGYGGWHHGF